MSKRKMSFLIEINKHCARCMVLVVLFLFYCPVLAHSQHESQKNVELIILDFVKEAKNCFFKIMSSEKGENLLGGDQFKKTPLTEAFIFEQFAKYAKGHIGIVSNGFSLTNEEAKLFCEEQLVRQYSLKYQEVKKTQDPKTIDLGKVGLLNIELTNSFIDTINNKLLPHERGHSEFTIDALSCLKDHNEDYNFSDDALLLIAKGSQSPDIYRWEEEVFHAHTPAFESSFEKDQAIRTGKENFIWEVIQNLENFKEVMTNKDRLGAATSGLLILGVVSHMVQDLVFHRGITLKQHSGLSYALDRDPDVPKNYEIARKRRDESVKYTKFILKQAKKMIPEDRWLAIKNWKKSDNFYFPKYAIKYFGNEANMDSWNLTKYWLKHVSYRIGKNKEQLEEERLALWNVPSVMVEIESQLNSLIR
jgi:hypothetical protein